MSFLTLFVSVLHMVVKQVLTIRVICPVSCERQVLLTLQEHLESSPDFGGVGVAHLFCFMCCVVFLLFCLSSSTVLCANCCQCPWIIHAWLHFSFVLRLLTWVKPKCLLYIIYIPWNSHMNIFTTAKPIKFDNLA